MNFKNSFLTLAASTLLSLLAPQSAFAGCDCWGDAPAVYAKVIGSFTPFFKGLIGDVGQSIERTVAESGASVSAEVIKSSSAQIATEEGLQAYREEQNLKVEAARLKDAMQQPATTCKAVSTAASYSAAVKGVQVRTMTAQTKIMERLESNTNSGKALEIAHNATNKDFCTPEEEKLGVCKVNTSSGYEKLAGADQDAAFLFQGTDGASSFFGVDELSPQTSAAASFINRIIGDMPPEQLRNSNSSLYESSRASRAYTELVRRYNAMLSISSYALNQIKMYHTTISGLGTTTKLATMSSGSYPNKPDMSVSEVIERFVASKFSPENVATLAAATEPHVILRDMAQMDAFRLQMSYHSMQQSSQMEAIAAHQLLLMADQALRPRIDSQRSAANGSATKYSGGQ